MRILLAIDGSTPSDRAVDLVASLPFDDDGRLRILSVAPTRGDVFGVLWGMPPPPDADELESAALRVHREALERAEREIRSARGDLTIEPVLLRGRAASVIADQARAMDAELVVVGHRGMGTWESRLLGSVSAEVVDHAPCPVLVVREEAIGPVVLADDGSTMARTAAALIATWPIFRGATVTVLGVVEDWFPFVAAAPPLYADSLVGYKSAMEAEKDARAVECEAVAEELRGAGVDASTSVRHGDPAHEIVAAARSLGAGLVVVGTRGRTGLKRLVLGSVARNVLLSAPCSVLVVRESVRHGGVAVGPGRSETEVISVFG